MGKISASRLHRPVTRVIPATLSSFEMGGSGESMPLHLAVAFWELTNCKSEHFISFYNSIWYELGVDI
jgi:hypothetical protein